MQTFRKNFEVLKVGAILCAAIGVVFSAGCTQNTLNTQEYINSPMGLTISLLVSQTYQVQFYSDNREGSFSGYGIFTDTTAAALNASSSDATMQTDSTAAAAFCNVASQPIYATTQAIQIGPSASSSLGSALCYLTTVTLTTGNYVALRARVERTVNPWSAAAIVQVP